ncbi:MAG: phage tail tape measure protein [Pseudomonadaceae bacterium]|jgi:TP901 family phage tail tape measure protein
MMSTEVELKLTADTSDAERGVGKFSQSYKSLVREITRPIGKVNAFRQLEVSLEETGRQSRTARERVRELGNEMARTETPSRQLTASYRDAIKELKTLEASERRQTAQLASMRQELKGAGVDTRNLAREQQRLQKELNQRMGRSDRAGALEAARSNLGLAAYGEAQTKVASLQRDLQLLQSTGKLSAAELAIVGGTISSAMGNARSLVQQNTQATATWTQSLQAVRGELLAGGLAFGAVGLAGKRSFDQFAGFEQRMAEIGTITNLSDAQLSELAVSVRKVSREMGEAASGGASALYDILSAGVSVGDSVKVLELSGKAAVAGLTDTKTAAGIGLAALNAYGDGTDKLEERFDQLFLTVKNGVTTFPQLAASLGQVLPVAAAAGISFGDVAASIGALTKQGLNTATATTALRGAITALTSPTDSAKKKMEELGIEWTDLEGTLQQIADRNLGVDVIRQIIPDTEARTAVLALTQDMAGLSSAMETMDNSGKTLASAFDFMKDTPEQQVKRFGASVNDMAISFGQAVAAGLPLLGLITDMLNAFNELDEGTRTTIAALVLLSVGGKALQIVIAGLRGPFSAFVASLAAVPAASAAATAAIGGTAGAVTLLGKAIKAVPLLALGGWAAANLVEIGQLYLEMRKLNGGIEEQEAALQKTIEANSAYRNAVVMTAEDASNLTETERKEYAERLRGAQQYYKALAEQTSRADMERDGPAAPVSKEALNAAAQARIYAEALTGFETATEKRESIARSHAETVEAIRSTELADMKTNLAEQQQALDKANGELEAASKRRAEIEKRYADLGTKLRSGPKATENNYAGLQSAKVEARKSLARGDTDAAIRQAERAAQILEAMREAGENEYGFAGIADELGRIAIEAAKLDESEAQAAVDAQKEKIDSLLKTAEALKIVQVGFVMDDESEEQVRQRLIKLASEWSKYMQDAVNVGFSGGEGPAVPAGGDGFARGGWTGPGSKYQVAGVVHADEYVQPKYRMQEPGALNFMEKFRRYGMAVLNNGYAEGGLVSTRTLPAIPAMSAALGSSAGGSALSPVNINLDGQTYTLQGGPDAIAMLARAAKIRSLRRS